MVRTYGFVALAVLCLAATASAAQPGAPAAPADSPDQAAARAAAKEFAVSLSEADLAKAKTLFGGTEEDFKSVQTFHATTHAYLRLRDAAAKAFPEEAAKAKPTNDLSPDAISAKIDSQPVKIDGDQAMFNDNGMRLKKIDGKWKVVDMFAGSQGKMAATTIMPVLARAANDTADDVEQGKLKSMTEMNKAMQDRMRAAMMAARPAGAGPFTRPTAAGPYTRPAR